MSQDLELQISALHKSQWVNLSGLVDCATKRLSKPTCHSIQLLRWGSYNTVYKLVFADGSEIAASVSVHVDEDFNPQAKLSEIATMQYVRASGSYPGIIVPQVHAWDVTFSNLTGAPYVLMDVVHGRKLERLTDKKNNLHGLDVMSEVQQLVVTKTLAVLQSTLSAPVPFDKIGSITLDDKGCFLLGPLFTITPKNLGGPYKSLVDLWRARLQHGILHALKEWSRLETDELFKPSQNPNAPLRIFLNSSNFSPHSYPTSSLRLLTSPWSYTIPTSHSAT
ncbi:hypothetical protein BDR07DRAFT_473380 [Suillus spraguei]|nr:hypothetical protein BDR07DRAFT_473380 [Suillus spraguei]